MSDRGISCIECGRIVTLQQVMTGKVMIDSETFVCSTCYMEFARDPKRCFAKVGTIDLQSGKVQYGYDGDSQACQFFCSDERLCREFIVRGIT